MLLLLLMMMLMMMMMMLLMMMLLMMLIVDVCVLQAAYDANQALVLCQMNDFRAGVLYLYEKMKLYVHCTSLLIMMCKTANFALSLFCEFCIHLNGTFLKWRRQAM